MPISFKIAPLPKRPTLPRIRLRFILLLIILTACTASAGDPAKVVEQYLTAKVAGDQQTMSGLLCSAMEGALQREASSFAGLAARLDNMSCQYKAGSSVVTCTGKIVMTYGTEQSDFPLTAYKVVQDDGQWKWCGEAAP